MTTQVRVDLHITKNLMMVVMLKFNVSGFQAERND